ncbi:Aste57867_11604 [Aphanomyces stellatus]|uniref:Aste57867_11604 protein n=1 Tax=Aphanomyces stellatus TaxID=120398 RepID=A0A485KTF4_9STRA|nr:hypothetical protein As57867_011561 [Aphanomyces stellatus]VFT88462.1 Aste57867_11604 [Aphanomyces stellatus]
MAPRHTRLYAALNVHPSMSSADMDRAFQTLETRLTPNEHTSSDTAVQESYAILSNPRKRKTYDLLGKDGSFSSQEIASFEWPRRSSLPQARQDHQRELVARLFTLLDHRCCAELNDSSSGIVSFDDPDKPAWGVWTHGQGYDAVDATPTHETDKYETSPSRYIVVAVAFFRIAVYSPLAVLAYRLVSRALSCLFVFTLWFMIRGVVVASTLVYFCFIRAQPVLADHQHIDNHEEIAWQTQFERRIASRG